MVEQWPIHYIMTQLGVTEFTSFRTVLGHLGIEPPPDIEIMDIMRERPLPAIESPP
jgi:hypothetical protein